MLRKDERELRLLVRLEQYTQEYMTLEREKEKYYRGHIDKINRTTIVTLYFQQIYIDSVIKKICMLVERLNKAQIDFENECATMVYNIYASNIKRGISDLL